MSKPQKLHFGAIWRIFSGPPDPRSDLLFISKKLVPSTSWLMTLLLNAKKISKTDKPFLRQRMDEETNRTIFIGRFSWCGGPKKGRL